MSKSIQFNLEVSDMEYDALTLLLEKANLTANDILLSKIKNWVRANSDLFSENELLRFAPILSSKTQKSKKDGNK
jgi:hypothetical protein